MPAHDSTERFTDRVTNYVRFRPGYPDELVEALETEGALAPGYVVADVGGGTGISAELFLRHGYRVVAVEPNAAMRTSAESWLGSNPSFDSAAGTAEATGLSNGCVDLVVAGQAFHWFDPAATRLEFARILRSPDRQVALFWNSRQVEDTPFLQEYERLLLEFGTDYAKVNHRRIGPEMIGGFFGGPYETRTFRTEQQLDLDGLEGRLLSSSYAPAPGHPRHREMLAALAELFDRRAEEGTVRVLYVTELFFGKLE